MTARQAFIDAIVADPLDDTARLVFADWLDERDDPLGEFIRVQYELEQRPMVAVTYRHQMSYLCSHKPHMAEWAVSPFDTFSQGLVIPRCGRCRTCRWCRLDARQDELLSLHREEWEGTLRHSCSACNGTCDAARPGDLPPECWLCDKGHAFTCVFRRGFVWGVSCSVPHFMSWASRVASGHPVQYVELRQLSIISHEYGNDVIVSEHLERALWYGLPALLYQRLRGDMRRDIRGGRGHFTSMASALSDVSRVCVAYGREQAGLPPLSSAW